MAGFANAAARLTDEHRTTGQRLVQLRRDFAAIVAASADSNADDEHDPEGSTIAFERAQIDALIEQAELHFAEIESAQRRIDAGTYGQCEACGRSIAAARLEARPIARTCVACAARVNPA